MVFDSGNVYLYEFIDLGLSNFVLRTYLVYASYCIRHFAISGYLGGGGGVENRYLSDKRYDDIVLHTESC